MKKTTFNLSDKDLRDKVRTFFQIIAVSLKKKLTSKELEYITEIALLPEKFEHQRFTAKAKKIIIPSLKESYGDTKVTIASLNLRKYALEEKGLVRKDEDGIYYFLKDIEIALDNIIVSHVKQEDYMIEIKL